jgi:hypothetical protein
MLENGDLKKVIMNDISFIHCFLQTTINKTIHTLISNQYTINNLATLITVADILSTNTLRKAIKEVLLLIRGL